MLIIIIIIIIILISQKLGLVGPVKQKIKLHSPKFPEIPDTNFIDLGRMKGWVDLGVTQWFSTRDPRIGNPAP